MFRLLKTKDKILKVTRERGKIHHIQNKDENYWLLIRNFASHKIVGGTSLKCQKKEHLKPTILQLENMFLTKTERIHYKWTCTAGNVKGISSCQKYEIRKKLESAKKKMVKMKINIQDLFPLLLLNALKDYRLFNTKTVSMGLRVYVMCENKM